jgi:hypothetical protein
MYSRRPLVLIHASIRRRRSAKQSGKSRPCRAFAWSSALGFGSISASRLLSGKVCAVFRLKAVSH